MADVEVQMQITTERKVRKVKKTSKRRESQDGTYEEQVTVTESSTNDKENLPAITQPEDNAGYDPHTLRSNRFYIYIYPCDSHFCVTLLTAVYFEMVFFVSFGDPNFYRWSESL